MAPSWSIPGRNERVTKGTAITDYFDYAAETQYSTLANWVDLLEIKSRSAIQLRLFSPTGAMMPCAAFARAFNIALEKSWSVLLSSENKDNYHLDFAGSA